MLQDIGMFLNKWKHNTKWINNRKLQGLIKGNAFERSYELYMEQPRPLKFSTQLKFLPNQNFLYFSEKTQLSQSV